jgi:dihydroneopterin aldolase/2-amino-4-hydroxy-6-hydroxymethyldihydropteridine diphosphokinase
MKGIFIGVGSNIDPVVNVRKALLRLRHETRILKVSTFYLTEPEGPPGQPVYYNGVLEVESDLSPSRLRGDVLRKIEGELGRKRVRDRYAPRTIDLDILLYGDLVLSDQEIKIPDPLIPVRPFLAVPLHELSPKIVLPDSGLPLEEIASKFKDHDMRPLPDYTRQLREELMT